MDWQAFPPQGEAFLNHVGIRKMSHKDISESLKKPADVLWLAQISHGIRNGVLIVEPQQRCELVLGQLLHPQHHLVFRKSCCLLVNLAWM